MRILKEELKNKKIEFSKLVPYGFEVNGKTYTYETKLESEDFKVIVQIAENEKCTAKLVDINTDEEYVLVDVLESEGKFVGNLKAKYEKCINSLIEAITSPNVFKSKVTLEVLEFAKEKFGDEPQFLWKKSPNNAVLRRKTDNKWYAAILTAKKSSLGFDDDTMVELIDLHGTEEKVASLVNGISFLKGYHMNKKRWFTILLDGSVSTEVIIEHLIESYETK